MLRGWRKRSRRTLQMYKFKVTALSKCPRLYPPRAAMNEEEVRIQGQRLEVMRMKSLLEEKKEGGDEVVAVAAVKVELAKKEEEVADLKQLLEEASVEFLMLGRANYRLEEREARLEEVEANLEAEQSHQRRRQRPDGGRGGHIEAEGRSEGA